MGIVNVTPDSFSDGGCFFETGAAVAHAMDLVRAGAVLLDIGGESTRPYSEPVSEEEELRRVLPVVEKLVRQADVPLSIDTSKPCVARECLAAGAEIVNDVTGVVDPEMIEVISEAKAGVCVMHMLGSPRTMQDTPVYSDVVSDVVEYLCSRRDALAASGIEQDRIALDPGIGFGKTVEHNLALLRSVDRLHDLGCPVLIGHSRKRFIGEVLGDSEAERGAGTIGAAMALAQRGAHVLRVHDVLSVRQALLLFEAAGGLER